MKNIEGIGLSGSLNQKKSTSQLSFSRNAAGSNSKINTSNNLEHATVGSNYPLK